MHILADHRENASGIVERLSKIDGVSVEVKSLTHGDYVINGDITTERKTAQDFNVSIIDGRLFTQLSNLKRRCVKPVLLIEGNPYVTDINIDRRAIRGAIINVQTIWYVPVIFSKTKEDTVETMIMIGRQDEQLSNVVPLRGSYRPKRLKSRQLFLLQGLPLVGPVMAKRLLEHFGSARNVMNASIDDLVGVDGVGIVTARKIRTLLDVMVKNK